MTAKGKSNSERPPVAFDIGNLKARTDKDHVDLDRVDEMGWDPREGSKSPASAEQVSDSTVVEPPQETNLTGGRKLRIIAKGKNSVKQETDLLRVRVHKGMLEEYRAYCGASPEVTYMSVIHEMWDLYKEKHGIAFEDDAQN